jgi:hypothetical protein
MQHAPPAPKRGVLPLDCRNKGGHGKKLHCKKKQKKTKKWNGHPKSKRPPARQQPKTRTKTPPIVECVEEGLEFEEDEEEADGGLKRWVPESFGIA